MGPNTQNTVISREEYNGILRVLHLPTVLPIFGGSNANGKELPVRRSGNGTQKLRPYFRRKARLKCVMPWRRAMKLSLPRSRSASEPFKRATMCLPARLKGTLTTFLKTSRRTLAWTNRRIFDFSGQLLTILARRRILLRRVRVPPVAPLLRGRWQPKKQGVLASPNSKALTQQLMFALFCSREALISL